MTTPDDKPSFPARLAIVATIAGVVFQLVLFVGGAMEKMHNNRAFAAEQSDYSAAEVRLSDAVKKGGNISIDDLHDGPPPARTRALEGKALLFVCLLFALSYLAIASLYYLIKGKPTNADAVIASRLYRVWGASVIIGAIYSFLI